MPNPHNIKHQQTLLATYRRTLEIQLNQRAALGANHAPPGIINGIIEARENIARIKGVLQSRGILVEDDPNDEEMVQSSVSESLVQPQSASGAIINIYGGIHSRSAQVGGKQHSEETNIIMDNSYDFSGANISGSNINVGSTLTDVTQSIGTIPNAADEDKQKLEDLVKQLKGLLQQVPEAQADDATKVANRTKAMVDEVQKTKPDKEFIEINGASLKKAAANIGAVMPAVLTIATQVTNHILSMVK